MSRLTAAFKVKALIRRVHDAGGSAMVLARGDDTAGAVLVLALERGEHPRFYERGFGSGGAPALTSSPRRSRLVGGGGGYRVRRTVRR